jgi:cytoskeletal protein RodZ
MKWPLLLALILVLALLIWFFFGRPIRKDAKAAHRADKDHPATEDTSAPVAAVDVPAEASVVEEPAEASVEAEVAETTTDDMTDADTAAVVAEAESVTAAAAADADADAETIEAEPVATEAVTAEPAPVAAEPEAAPAAEAPAATNGAPYAGAVLPAADGSSSDDAYSIKGSSGKKYHTTASPYYGRTKAAVYFDSEESAEAAGFVVGFKKKANA